ncbi:hypothetical protein F383_27758 [Gossypium arboreum]|uniref:Uncharacterized protein n=1 Tax=Gossypium arboreum TaxID=29729 RepID=A0A0B0PDG3_GOSAR|nr:hypothetical protein F383_27758 [Gossypium arboreum]
MPSGLARIY